MRGGLQSKGQPCRLSETRQLPRLETGGTGTHVEFHPVGEYEAHPRTALWESLRSTHWCVGYSIELRRDLGKRHSGLLQPADVDEAFQMRRGVMRSAPCPEGCRQEPTLDIVTHRAARHPS
jgi:hypothetical protein